MTDRTKSVALRTVAAILLFIAGAKATSYPIWPGLMAGVADYQGNQFSTVNPFPASLAYSSTTPIVSTSVESSHVFKASAGLALGFAVTSGATPGYLMVFNATTPPSDGSVLPVKCLYVPANQTIGLSPDPGAAAWLFSAGITTVFSSTGCFTKTASATAFFSGQVQ